MYQKEHGKNAKVAGYRIGGKTGTSEDGVNTNKYVTSFLGVVPIEDPQVVLLITLYNPTGEGGHQGGGVAAPVAGEILKEVLPYMEIQTKEQENKETVNMPNVTNLSFAEAKKILNELDLGTNSQLDAETIITEQLPKAGIQITKGTKVILYGN